MSIGALFTLPWLFHGGGPGDNSADPRSAEAGANEYGGYAQGDAGSGADIGSGGDIGGGGDFGGGGF